MRAEGKWEERRVRKGSALQEVHLVRRTGGTLEVVVLVLVLGWPSSAEHGVREGVVYTYAIPLITVATSMRKLAGYSD